jgi:tetratricopeptide (TPR) repeat protein
MLRRPLSWVSSSLAIAAVLANAPAALAGNDAAPAGDTAAPAAAAPNEAAVREASDHYEAGLALYADGEFKRAAIEFDRAYELVPNYRALYNIGQVRIQLHDYARATKALKAYLKEGGDKIDSERKKSVSDDIEMLATRTATLTVESNEAGAEVLVDGELAGTTPLAEPLLLDTGDHRIAIHKEGFDTREEALTLASRDSQSLRIDIQKTAAQSGPVVVVAPQAAPADRTALIGGAWAFTAAFAVTAGITGGLGISAANDLDKLRNTYGSSRYDLNAAQSRAQTLLRVSDVFGAAAIVTGGVALYLTLSKPSKEKEKAHTAVLHLGPRSVALTTTF